MKNRIILILIVFSLVGCASTSGSQVQMSDEEIERQREAANIAYNEMMAQQAQREAAAEEARLEQQRQREAAEAARNAPRFSPEGQEYIKRTLIQAVGEANNSANFGKTLFFQSSRLRIRDGGLVGNYHVSEDGSNNIVIMEYFDRLPIYLYSEFWGYTILYRVEISRIGLIKYKIDSIPEDLNRGN